MELRGTSLSFVEVTTITKGTHTFQSLAGFSPGVQPGNGLC